MTNKLPQSFWPKDIGEQDVIPMVPLYKFMSLSPNVPISWHDRIFQLLGGQAYLSSPESFNDPFDCLPTVAIPKSLDEYFANLPRLVARFNKAMPDVETSLIEQVLRNAVRNNGLDALAELTRTSFAASGRGLGVFCLTERIDQVLMWSHYADNHRGIAIRFEPLRGITDWKASAQIRSRLLPMFKVRYREERARIMSFFDKAEHDTEHNDAMVDALRTKATFWQYEDEWRVIEPDGARQLKTFDPQIITGFILGAKIDAEDEAWLREVAQGHGLEVLKVEADRDTFGLHLREL